MQTQYIKKTKGSTFYYKDKKMAVMHREDGPAIEYITGGKEYWVNGVRHREDGPAIECMSGYKEWWVNGKLHREDGPAIEYSRGKEWYKNGKLHREDGPAVEYIDGYRMWVLNDVVHREDGPAVEFNNGDKEWWLNGKPLTKEQFDALSNALRASCDGKVVVVDGKQYKLVAQ